MRILATRPAITLLLSTALFLVLVGTGPNPPPDKTPPKAQVPVKKVAVKGKAVHKSFAYCNNCNFVITVDCTKRAYTEGINKNNTTCTFYYRMNDAKKTLTNTAWILKGKGFIKHADNRKITLIFTATVPNNILTTPVIMKDGKRTGGGLSSGSVTVTVPTGPNDSDSTDCNSVYEVTDDPCSI